MEPRRRSDELVSGPEDDEVGPGRRRLWWAVALVCGVVAAGVLRPDLTPVADRAVDPRPTGVPTGDTSLSVVAWDTRGDLAQDTDFIRAAVTRVRQERPEVARVFFAGRLPDGGRLVLAGTDVFRGIVATAVHALVVGPGSDIGAAPVTELTALTDPRQVAAWAGRGRTGHVYAVVLSRPGPVRFELSPHVRFDVDGTPRRVWTPVYTEDGVVVADLGDDADPVVTVRATGTEVFPDQQPVRVATAPGAAPTPPVVRGVGAPSYHGPDPDRLVRGLQQSAGSLADLGASRLRVLWSGAPWRQRRLALVLVTRPDGLRLQALVGQQGSSEFSAGVRALPRWAPSVVPWLLEPFSPQDPTFLLCPTGAGTVVYRRAGRPDQRFTVRGSGAVGIVEPGPGAPSAGGAEVTLLDPQGRRLLTTILPEGGLDDPLALD